MQDYLAFNYFPALTRFRYRNDVRPAAASRDIRGVSDDISGDG
jgi:hypothetical protein